MPWATACKAIVVLWEGPPWSESSEVAQLATELVEDEEALAEAPRFGLATALVVTVVSAPVALALAAEVE